MNRGRLAIVALLVAAVAAGVGVWYAQEYGYYAAIDPAPATIAAQPAADGGAALELPVTGFQGIDASSSPLRWRACFHLTDAPPAGLSPYPDATPLTGPGWFDCYDARRISADLASGAAVAVLGTPEIHPNVDRVLAIYPDGRAFGWHQYNDKTPARGVMD